MRVAQRRLEAAVKRVVGRAGSRRDASASRAPRTRWRRVEMLECRKVRVSPSSSQPASGMKPSIRASTPIGSVDESRERVAPVAPASSTGPHRAKPSARAASSAGGSQSERQVIAALEMRRPASSNCARRSASTSPEAGSGKPAVGIALGRPALGLDKDRPARAEPSQRIVEPRADGDELGLRRAIEVGPAKARGALEAAVLVEDDAAARPALPRADSRRASARGGDIRARFSMADLTLQDVRE